MARNLGLYFNDEQEALVEAFDERFDGEKRAAKVRDAMELYLAVEDALESSGLDDLTEDSKRRYLQSLIWRDDREHA